MTFRGKNTVHAKEWFKKCYEHFLTEESTSIEYLNEVIRTLIIGFALDGQWTLLNYKNRS